MSHIPQRLCPDGHAWSSWTTHESTNAAGEKCFVFQRECFACGLVDSELGGTQDAA